MDSFYIKHTHTNFHYRKFGSGKKLVFAFHGYGRDSYTFYFLEKYLGINYTVIAIDLPFHGLTEWDKELTFHPSYMVQVIQEIRKELNGLNEHFILLGYSMGGRIALHLAEIMHKHIERLVLIAPDGLKINFFHALATQTWGGHKLLQRTVYHPQWLMKTLSLAERTNIISKSISSFVHYYMDDEAQRLMLFRRWTTMRKFVPKLSRLRKYVLRNKIKVRMLFGKYDKVIFSSGGEHFVKGIEQYASLQVIDTGHDLLLEYNAKYIAGLFNDE